MRTRVQAEAAVPAVENPKAHVYGVGPNGRPLDWRGHEMNEAGRGAYPYDCPAKDKWPDAMVYECATCRVWDHDRPRPAA